MGDADKSFYSEIPDFVDFARVVDDAVYQPVPDSWRVGLTDVVSSTKAIADGRQKAVNIAGAAAISAVMNALGHRDFPFVFGGDGASFAVGGEEAESARDALARTARWVEEDLGLELRTAMLAVGDIRAAGHDLRVARFAASNNVSYAMFSGQGIGWAEAEMKKGRYAIDPAPPQARPDLTGLSCRWTPIVNTRGCILSLIVAPERGADSAEFAKLTRRLIASFEGYDRGGHPVPKRGPGFTWPPAGLDLEARASRGEKPLGRQKRLLRLAPLIAWVLDKTGWKVGGFDPLAYRTNTSLNTDFRKFDDVLRMTVDCDPKTLAETKDMLEEARRSGVARYGISEQDAALMTCIVPSVMTHDHLHFLDGAGGG
ncbi:MAG: DUF3095 domain-containing protein, partial [Rhodovibrionaceae bacterium]|nr:DUF3095 domain-containing protein [Rhodovibrionaceae bacterium]